MSWFVYLLVSRSLYHYNHTYVGITTDLKRRLDQHNGVLSGGAKCTMAKRPYEIAFYLDNINNRSIASKIEYDVKQKKGYDKRLNYMMSLKKIEN
jgi:putative endonuclease